jgi:hypothetical protein
MATTKKAKAINLFIYSRPDPSGNNWYAGCPPLFDELIHFDDARKGEVFKKEGNQYVLAMDSITYECNAKLRVLQTITGITQSIAIQVPRELKKYKDSQMAEYYDQYTDFGWMRKEEINTVEKIKNFLTENKGKERDTDHYRTVSQGVGQVRELINDKFPIFIPGEGFYKGL